MLTYTKPVVELVEWRIAESEVKDSILRLDSFFYHEHQFSLMGVQGWWNQRIATGVELWKKIEISRRMVH